MDSFESEIENTIKCWPNTSQLQEKISIPIALTFCPTAPENNYASFNEKNLQKYRCQSCKAFINKFCQIRNSNSYDCSLCGFSNHIDENIDINWPEMNQAIYKCRALKIQRTIMSKERVLVFILDFSDYGELSQKYLLYSIHAIRQWVNHAVDQKKNVKIMLLGFDNGIQIFHIKNEVQRLVYWDEDNLSANDFPFSNQQLGSLAQSKDNILAVLDVLEEQVNLRRFRNNTSSKKIMQVVEYALKHTRTESGKIFVVSGLNHELQKFRVMRNYDSTIQDSYKHHFPIVKKQCLSETLRNLLNITQMSVSFFFHKTMYAVIFQQNFKNLMPFHVISKSTNGQLRHYLKNQTDHFFYDFNYFIHECLYEMKFETLLRVRPAIGLKLVGIFGNYRPWKGISEQVELLSCHTNRRYSFQFIVEGKISSPSTVIQFSVLYTDLKGNRYFKIITNKITLASEMSAILPQINYQAVNQVYLGAILHNMDLTPQFRKLQLALQDRCKRHLKALRELHYQINSKHLINNQNLIHQQFMKKARSHVIFTYMLMQHFLLNLHERRDIFLDINIQARSKLATYEDAMQMIWPIAYVVDEKGFEVVEMKIQNFILGKIGIVIDRGDRIQIYLQNQEQRNCIRMARDFRKAIDACPQLETVSNLLREIQEKKSTPHLDILIVEQQYMMSFCIFSRTGNHSFQNFIETLLQN